MAYKLNKFATLCQEEDVVDIDINMEPTEGEEAEAVAAEIEANEAAAEVDSAMDQLDNADMAADEVEEKIEEGEAVIAVSEPAVDNGGEVPADVVVTTDSGKELTEEEVAEAVEKLNEAGEVAPEVVVEQEAFIQRIELITGLKRRSPGIALESARRNSTDSYKLCQEGLKEIGASIKEFIKKIWEWIKDKFDKLIEFIKKYLPTKAGKVRRMLPKLAEMKDKKIKLSELSVADAIYINICPPEVLKGTMELDTGLSNVISELTKVADKVSETGEQADTSKLEAKNNELVQNMEKIAKQLQERLEKFSLGAIATKSGTIKKEKIEKELKDKGYDLAKTTYVIGSVIPDISGKVAKDATATVTILVYEKDADKAEPKTETITVNFALTKVEVTVKEVHDVLEYLISAAPRFAKNAEAIMSTIKKALVHIQNSLQKDGNKTQASAEMNMAAKMFDKEIKIVVRGGVKTIQFVLKTLVATMNASCSRYLNVYSNAASLAFKK